MKRLCLIAIAFIGTLSAAWSQGGASAGYLKQAFVRVTDSAAGAAKLGNYGYAEGISILGAWVNVRDYCDFSIPLTKNVNYMFAGGGDNDAHDVDIEIQDAAGRILATENRVAPDAMVTFTPDADEFYTLRLRLAKARDNLPCVCVICVLREDGYKVPLKNLDDCAGKLMNLFTETDKVLQKDKTRLELRKSRNQWAIYGAVLDHGKSINVTNLDMGATRRLLLAMGDNNAADVDLFLMDAKGTVLLKDDSTKSDASIVFLPRALDRYSIKMLNYKASGPSVVMSGLFDVLQK